MIIVSSFGKLNERQFYLFKTIVILLLHQRTFFFLQIISKKRELGAPIETISCQFFNVYVKEAVQYVIHIQDYKDSVEGEYEEFQNLPGYEFTIKKMMSRNKKNCWIPNLILKCLIAWKTTAGLKMYQLTHLLLFIPDQAKILCFPACSLLTSLVVFF